MLSLPLALDFNSFVIRSVALRDVTRQEARNTCSRLNATDMGRPYWILAHGGRYSVVKGDPLPLE